MFEHQSFDFAQADIEADIEPDRTRNNLDWGKANQVRPQKQPSPPLPGKLLVAMWKYVTAAVEIEVSVTRTVERDLTPTSHPSMSDQPRRIEKANPDPSWLSRRIKDGPRRLGLCSGCRGDQVASLTRPAAP
ncbi:hypothetical protein [Rhizobium sp. ZPR3]|uniref:Uncharacterized protein n=2 Tax=unclassified Rhizobium TaxID=2613769 RepID=A0AAU7SI28_9HYPH